MNEALISVAREGALHTVQSLDIDSVVAVLLLLFDLQEKNKNVGAIANKTPVFCKKLILWNKGMKIFELTNLRKINRITGWMLIFLMSYKIFKNDSNHRFKNSSGQCNEF
ncbi:MAG TPA: hypothetical protein VFQ86_03655 [Arachidicoccus soli]|nr:hypothetical protein [Arachidicoccus soli]